MKQSIAILIGFQLVAQAPVEIPNKPRQMEIKGTLTSTPLARSTLKRAAAEPNAAARRNYKIPLNPAQSIKAEIKSPHSAIRVRILNPKDLNDIGAKSQEMNLRNDQAFFLNVEKKAMEVVVQVETMDLLIDEPYVLTLTEIDTKSYLLEKSQKR